MNKILIMLIAAALGGGVYWYAMSTSAPLAAENIASTDNKETTKPAEKTLSPADEAEIYRQTYYAQFKYPTYVIGTIQTFDGPYDGIIGVDENGVRRELVPVRLLSKAGDWTFYYSFKPGTDAGAWPYFALNTKTGQLKILMNTTAYIETGYPDKKRISPDGRYILSAYRSTTEPHEGVLYRIDLQEDSVTPIHTLASGETYISDYRTMTGYGTAEIEWIGPTTIRYGVFTKSKNPTNTRLRTEMLDMVTGKITVE